MWIEMKIRKCRAANTSGDVSSRRKKSFAKLCLNNSRAQLAQLTNVNDSIKHTGTVWTEIRIIKMGWRSKSTDGKKYQKKWLFIHPADGKNSS
jgi:hypothetical protein